MTKTDSQQTLGNFNKGCLLFWGILLLFSGFSPAQEVTADSPPLEDIRDIMVEKPPPSPIPVILTIGLVLVLVAMACILFRKFIRRTPAVSGPPPEMIARRKLNHIGAHFEEMEPNKASLETSEAVKDFLTAQYRDPIRYETAEEYLARITHTPGDAPRKLSPSLTEQVKSFISISQELKFARLKEARDRIPSLIEQAEAIVGMAVREERAQKNKSPAGRNNYS